MSRKLLLLNGMTPGGGVFRKLQPLLPNSEVIEWCSPKSAWSISEYAQQLVLDKRISGPCDVLGVSFGGIVAQELASIVGARICFLVSSVECRSELPLICKVLSIVPAVAHDPLMSTVGDLANYWPTQNSATTIRARKFSGETGVWFRWASKAIIQWKPQLQNSYRIVRVHGDRDATFPRGHKHAGHVFSGAGHLLAVSHASELAEIIALEQAKERGETKPVLHH